MNSVQILNRTSSMKHCDQVKFVFLRPVLTMQNLKKFKKNFKQISVKRDSEMGSKAAQTPEIIKRVGKSDKYKFFAATISSIILAYFVSAWLTNTTLSPVEDALSDVNFVNETEFSKAQKYFVQDQDEVDSSVNVRKVLDLLGWQQVENLENSDLMWFQNYPFTTYSAQMKSLKPHQRVNHFPGSGYVTSKALMARTVKSEHIPKAFYPFEDTEKIAEYFAKNPEKKFVEKNICNRGVSIKAIKDINMTDSRIFIQEFIENPLLLDGHMFDIGIRVVVTSIDPLRLYIHDDEMVIRFCLEEYHPFDPLNVKKYVVYDGQPYGDYYLPLIARHTVDTQFGLRGIILQILLLITIILIRVRLKVHLKLY